MKKRFTMTKKDAQLVVDSIVLHERCDGGYCPLCGEYFKPAKPATPDNCCTQCPVVEYTGISQCDGTPFYDKPAYSKAHHAAMVKFGLKMLDDAGYEIVEA